MIEGEHEQEGGAPSSPSLSDDPAQEARREVLKKMGRYAAYTAPTLLALLASTRSACAGS